MEIKMDTTEVFYKIKNEIPRFNEEEFFEYIKCSIPRLYSSLKNETEIDVKCNPELAEKLINNKEIYRIRKEIDYISIQHTRFIDYIKEEDTIYVKVYLSIYFKDDVSNNAINLNDRDKFWNDIWVISYKKDLAYKNIDPKCNNCGAIMKYNKIDEVLRCDYCGNIKMCSESSNWELIDIEVNN